MSSKILEREGIVGPLRPANREELAFWWALVVPLAVMVLGLKIWRVVHRGEVAAWWAAPDLLRSDLLAVAAFALLGWALLRGLKAASRARLGAFLILQVAAAIWVGLEVVAHHFFSVTGSSFDLHLLFFSLGRFGETLNVVASETPATTWIFFGIALLLMACLPWVLRARMEPKDKSYGDGKGPRPRRLAAALLVGTGCVAFASLPAIGEDYRPFGRANVINLALSLQDIRKTTEVEQLLHRRPLDELNWTAIEGDDQPHKNVAIIILESTRAQSMTVYEPEMETTPFLAELAERATVADRAYAVVPHTSKALVAILCGIEPRLRMPITEAMDGGLPARCLAELLGEQGYRSVFLQSATERFEDRPGLVDNMGFDDFVPLEMMETGGFERANYFGYEDAVMLPDSRRWLETHGDEPFLATYLTLTPHHDYLAPRRRYGRHHFDDDDELNRYKNTLYYVDQFTKELLEQYRQLGLYEDTVFVVVGDHGEGFEEHGRSQHDNVIWEEGIRVPLMIYDPSRPEKERLQYPVSHIDVVPTIAEWLGYDVDGGHYPGMSIFDSHDQRAVYAHCWYERRCMARVGHRFKYIDHFGRQSPEVYDLLSDPREQQNRADEMGEEIRHWRAEVYGWRESVNAMYRGEQVDRVREYVFDEVPQGVEPLTFDLGDFVRYRGYEIDAEELRPGQRVQITHYFEVLRSIPPGWRLFVHGQSGQGMINLDHTPVDGLHPLDEWRPGTIVADEHSFRIPRDWSGEVFTLYVGIYHTEQGRVAIEGDVPTDGDRRAAVFEQGIK